MAMPNTPYAFVSYVRNDQFRVRSIVDELHKLGVETWVDWERLTAGQSWQHAIRDALEEASVLLVFISPQISREFEQVESELHDALVSGIPVLPVLLDERVERVAMPIWLQQIQYLDATSLSPRRTAKEIEKNFKRMILTRSPPPIAPKEAERDALAKVLVEKIEAPAAKPDDAAPSSIFVVHGHDEEFLHEVVEFVEGLGIEAIVLKDVGGAARSLIEKFFEIGGKARFAIVLISADDMGASRIQFDEPEVGSKALKYRSRQNTILELGYFYGLLNWDKVFVLEKPPPKRFPDFERPSDLSGVVFDRYDATGKWKKAIAQRLEQHGFVFAKV
jgi:predicted nucleotide-binding protein